MPLPCLTPLGSVLSKRDWEKGRVTPKGRPLNLLSCVLSRVQLFGTPWTIARQAPLSMGSSRQEYWSGLPCPPPGDLPHPGIETVSLRSPAPTAGFFTTSATFLYCCPFYSLFHELPSCFLFFFCSLHRQHNTVLEPPLSHHPGGK